MSHEDKCDRDGRCCFYGVGVMRYMHERYTLTQSCPSDSSLPSTYVAPLRLRDLLPFTNKLPAFLPAPKTPPNRPASPQLPRSVRSTYNPYEHPHQWASPTGRGIPNTDVKKA